MKLLLLIVAALAGCAPPYYREFLITELQQPSSPTNIPKIIHQVWHIFDQSKPSPPEQFRTWADELKANHPGWTYILWDQKSSEELIEKHYPWFLDTYRSYDKPIKRADAIRYFILHQHGGIYADMSCQNLRNLDQLLAGADVVVGEQDDIQVFSINMAFMASTPSHPLFNKILRKLPKTKDLHVLKATGPAFFTESINQFLLVEPSRNVRILHKKFLYPYPWYDKDNPNAVRCRQHPSQCRQIFPDAFMVKHWPASWQRQYE